MKLNWTNEIRLYIQLFCTFSGQKSWTYFHRHRWNIIMKFWVKTWMKCRQWKGQLWEIDLRCQILYRIVPREIELGIKLLGQFNGKYGSTSKIQTVVGFHIQSYANPGPFEIRTKMSGFWMASLDHFVTKKNFMAKRSRLEVKKTSVRISNVKNKMAAIIWQPFCFFPFEIRTNSPDFE
jgi:hypothetical protein